MTTYSALHYARLSPDRQPQPCSQAQWRAWVDSPQYTPILLREQLDDWEVDLTFTGTWAGRGTPKFFALWISGPARCGTLRQFVTYEQAWRALSRVLAKRRLRGAAYQKLKVVEGGTSSGSPATDCVRRDEARRR